MKKNLRFYIPLLLIVIIALGSSSCKSKKKVSELSDPKDTPAEQTETAEVEEMEEEEAEESTPSRADRVAATISKLNSYFADISSAPSAASANQSINEALNMFESPDALVLIIIHEGADGKKDYDEPTTARKYLNYLKDQKKNPHKIDAIIFNGAGEISELELIKK